MCISAPRDGFVVVAVEDDGPGIPADKVANLFRRGHGVTHGTGLALMLIEDVVAAHGGTIDVKSKCDAFASGTTSRCGCRRAQAPGAPPG
jgi:signal transduction histidine kinase